MEEGQRLAMKLVDFLRPHLTEEDMYYVEGVTLDEDWDVLIQMMRSFAMHHHISLPEDVAV